MGAESWVTSKVHQRIDTSRDMLWTGVSRDLCESDRHWQSNKLGFTGGKKEIQPSFSPQDKHMDIILRKQLLCYDISLYFTDSHCEPLWLGSSRLFFKLQVINRKFSGRKGNRSSSLKFETAELCWCRMKNELQQGMILLFLHMPGNPVF